MKKRLTLQSTKLAITYHQEKKFFHLHRKKEGKLNYSVLEHFHQAEKFLDLLQNRQKGLDYKSIRKEISFSKRNEIWIGKGRSLGVF